MPLPVVAIISNSLTPYRLHYHRRFVREAPGIHWYSLFTHDVSNAPWSPADEAEINPVRFGPGERSDDQAKVSRTVHEFRKGGRIIQWLVDHRAAAVVLLGYNDAGRLRIARWCRKSSVPCFLFGDSNIRGDRSAGLKAWLKRRILPSVLRQFTGILACGSLGRAYFRQYGVPDDAIFYTPYEPDYAMIASITDSEVQTIYARHNLPTGRDYLLYCGRLVDVKRVDLAIAAFIDLAAVLPNWDLLIVGDGPLREALQHQVPETLRYRVHWTGFSADQREVAAWQRGAKVLVIPSDFEPWGVVVNEAVAAGLAVVASDAVGAAAELVRDGVNGRMFPAGDLSALTQALLDATTYDTLHQMRTAAPMVLATWGAAADPVAGVLQALKHKVNCAAQRSSRGQFD